MSAPVFGEVQPHILHEVADVSVDVSPVGLVRHNARYITQCFIVERIPDQIVDVSTMRHTCETTETQPGANCAEDYREMRVQPVYRLSRS